MEGDLFAAPVVEARGRTGDLTVPGSGEALDGGLLIAETGGFETGGERGGLEAVGGDNGWTLGGRTESCVHERVRKVLQVASQPS